MASLYFITHPEVIVDPAISIQRWQLSPRGIERMRAFSATASVKGIETIWSSAETKAIEAAGILGGALGIGIRVDRELGENDRSSTGFVPPAEFEKVVDAFFAKPNDSVRGWERACDAQARVRRSVVRIVAEHTRGDIAIVAHGAVGTLLLCALIGKPISRSRDQPHQGHFWHATLPHLRPKEGWRSIA